MSVTIVTDGSAVGMALADTLGPAVTSVIEARGVADVPVVIAAKRASQAHERVVALTPDGQLGDLDAHEAYEVARRWLSDLSPIEQRSRGAKVIASKVADGVVGAEAIQALANRLIPRMSRLVRDRPGRPTGSDPFRGLGLELIVTILLRGKEVMTERQIAGVLQRSHTGVHRVVTELARRGYLVRGRAGSRVRDELTLRDDLVAAWRGRVSIAREADTFAAQDPRNLASRLFAAAQRSHRALLLAGPSAVAGPEAPAGGPIVVYLEGEPGPVMESAGLSASRAADVVVWPVVESAILLEPRNLGGLAATNRVITFADLALVGSDRSMRAAEAVWRDT